MRNKAYKEEQGLQQGLQLHMNKEEHGLQLQMNNEEHGLQLHMNKAYNSR